MANEACPLPTPPTDAQEQVIQRILKYKNIAVVGLSDDPSRTSHHVGVYLQSHGYHLIPINPNYKVVLGQPSLNSLAELHSPPDLVLVFRRPEFCGAVAREAIAARTKALWLQSGITNAEARRLAQQAGIDYIEDRCLMVEHMHHRRR